MTGISESPNPPGGCGEWDKACALVSDCIRCGITEYVICAGARNAALIEVLAQAEPLGKVRLWRHFEERSAGFFALGRCMETGSPCAVVTTSGTAVAELLPAMIEAHYQCRPLVALTADRPAAFRGSGAPQAIEQVGIFGAYAASGPVQAWQQTGPLHLNPEFEESFFPGVLDAASWSAATPPPAWERPSVAEFACWLRTEAYRGMVVMVGGLEPDEREEVYHFCRDLNVPVVAEATSGLRESLAKLAIHDADRMLKHRPPGKILRLGEVPSGRFWRDLEELPHIQVWSVCRNGLPGLSRPSQVTRGPVDRVLKALGPIDPLDDALDLWAGASARAARIDELLEAFPDSEPGMLRMLSNYASVGSGVFLGNSLPIREWNSFAQWQREVTQVRANRGANGIDGQISTWLGCSADLSEAWAVVGDLTALYDLAAPFVLKQIEPSGRVLAVIHNGGGGIFSRLPRLQAMHPRAAECMTNPHDADLAGFAAIWDMRFVRISRVDDFDAFEPGDRPVLLEIRPDPEQTLQFWQAWDRLAPA